MFGSLMEKMKSTFWSDRTRLEKFLAIIMGIFALVITVLSSLVACHYQQASKENVPKSDSIKRFYFNEQKMNNKSSISTHVLDLTRGLPASNVAVTLSILSQNNQYQSIIMKRTNDYGRIEDMLGTASLVEGRYKMQFETGEYYQALNVVSFYPSIEVIFNVIDALQFYHIPITLSPYGYSTYRGS